MKATLFTKSLTLITVGLFMAVCIYPVKGDSEGPICFQDSGVAVYSPINMTYNANYLFLNLTVSSAGMMGSVDSGVSVNYNIDGLYTGPVPLRSDGEIHIITRANATITLPKLTDGPHNLTLSIHGLNQRAHEPKYQWYTNTVYFSTTGNPPAPTASPTTTSSPSPIPSSTPTTPELSGLIIFPLILFVVPFAVLLRYKKWVS